MNDNAVATELPPEPQPESGPLATSELPPIIWVDGRKGGVGKSMWALAALDYYETSGTPVLFVETDTSNPDVYRCLQRDPKNDPDRAPPNVLMGTALLSERVGWLELVDLVDAHRDRTVLVNLAANLSDSVRKHGHILHRSLPDLGRRLITFWLLNRQRDCVDQLREHLQLFPSTVVHAVRNGHFGSDSQFELYNASRVRAQLEEAGGHSLTLPDLADRVADAIYTKRLTIADGMANMPISNRSELGRWREEVHGVLAEALA